MLQVVREEEMDEASFFSFEPAYQHNSASGNTVNARDVVSLRAVRRRPLLQSPPLMSLMSIVP